MIKVKEGIHWYKWVCENLRDPFYVSDSAPYIVEEALASCLTTRELAIALWAALDFVTIKSVENKLEDVIEEVADDE